jgi:magnesium transporter
MRLIAYESERLEEKEVQSIAEALEFAKEFKCVWLDIAGPLDDDLKDQLENDLGVHRLVIQDLRNDQQRPKVEEFGEILFCVCKAAELTPDGEFIIDMYSVLLKGNLMVTIQGTEHDCLDRIRRLVRTGENKTRIKSVDYLFYLLVDAVIQSYFPLIENIGEQLDDLEDQLVANPTRKTLNTLHAYKRELLDLRRAAWPHRELVLSLSRDDYKNIGEAAEPYFRDVYDHIVQILDWVETSRELCSDLVDLYMSSISQRMNEIMKVLTVVTTIFIPLSFVAGVWGMNFTHMPELKEPWGYGMAWGVFILLGLGQVMYMKYKGWIGDG